MASGGETLILLVEDDPDFLEIEQACLEAEGFLTVPARNGERALRLLERVRPDVIVTDMMMPVLDGIGFLDRYGASPGAHAPVVALSSFQAYLDLALERGAAAALGKPISPESLSRAIRRVASGEAPMRVPAPGLSREEDSARFQAILHLHLDQRAPETAIQTFIDEVAHHFGVPIALLSVVTVERQFWSASCGAPDELGAPRGIPRREAFCSHAVAARAALVVQDVRENPLFRDNETVRKANLRFYAGVPLIARHGQVLGTLCLMDHVARTFTHMDLELLSVFGRRLLAELERRERLENPGLPESGSRYRAYLDEELDIFAAEGFHDVVAVEACRGPENGIPISVAAIAVAHEQLKEVVARLRERQVTGLVGRLGRSRLGWLVPGARGAEVRDAAREVAGPEATVEAIELGPVAGAVDLALQRLESRLGDAGL